MHEYSIVQALVERIEAEAAARHATSVGSVLVRIGELAGVDVELLATAYRTFGERTICEHSSFEIVTVRAEWACRDCGFPVPRGGPLRCPTCGGAARLQCGDEILLERIEMEVEEVDDVRATETWP